MGGDTPVSISIDSREGAAKALARVAALNARRLKLMAEREAALNAARARFPEITDLEREMESLYEALGLWAVEDSPSWEGRKSLDLPHGTIGFRTGAPKLILARKKFGWGNVLDYLQKHFAHLVRVKAEVNKELILAEARKAENGLSAEVLRQMGLKVDQEEGFYYQLKDE